MLLSASIQRIDIKDGCIKMQSKIEYKFSSRSTQGEMKERSQENRNRCVKMNNAVLQPSVRCGARQEQETPLPSVQIITESK